MRGEARLKCPVCENVPAAASLGSPSSSQTQLPPPSAGWAMGHEGLTEDVRLACRGHPHRRALLAKQVGNLGVKAEVGWGTYS